MANLETADISVASHLPGGAHGTSLIPYAAPPKRVYSDDIHRWTAEITELWHRNIKGFFDMGRLLKDAKVALPHGDFRHMIERELPFKSRMAQLYMKLADDPKFAPPRCISHLPPSIGTLTEISKLPEGVYDRLVADKVIHPGVTRGEIATIISNAEARSRHESIVLGARQHNLTGRRFHIGVADPPWEGQISRGTDPYPRSAIQDICIYKADDGRPIRDVFADDAILYMWTTDEYIFDVPAIFEVWGFRRHNHMMFWPKATIKLGQFARVQHEVAFIGTRGNFKPPETGLRHSTLIANESETLNGEFRCAPPHDQRHSSKPPRLQEMIEAAYPQYFGPKAMDDPVALELFSRVYRPGWAGQGYEYPGAPTTAMEGQR
jgi:N6-adenosine-specific RNA methylase IME4